jgi:hypothetical protein
MAEGIESQVPETLTITSWLADFCRALESVAERFTTAYSIMLVSGKYDGLTYLSVGQALRTWLKTQIPLRASNGAVRGSAFGISLAGEAEQAEANDNPTTSPGGPTNSRKRSRAPTDSGGGKRDKTRCSACGGWHPLPKCWYVIESKRPENWKPAEKTMAEYKRKLQEDKSFADLVKKAKKEALDTTDEA